MLLLFLLFIAIHTNEGAMEERREERKIKEKQELQYINDNDKH